MDRRSWALFGVVCLVWGIPYFLIKVALHDVSPLALVWIRIVVGALTLLPFVTWPVTLPLLVRRRGWLVVLAVIEIVLPFVLITGGEQYISSSLTGILIATEPLGIALLALRFDHSERIGGTRLIGTLVGLIGVVVLLGGGLIGLDGLAGSTMILAATLCYGAGALIIKQQFSDIAPAGTVCAALTIAAVVLAVPAAFNVPHALPPVRTMADLFVLGTACTGLGFIAFFALIARAGAGRAAVITYVTPAVALLLGVVVRHEPVTLVALAGMALILIGSWSATLRPGNAVNRAQDAA